MKTWMRYRLVLALASVMISSGPALAADPAKPAAPADPSPEQRHKMAEVHQRMADCLVSARPMSECRGEMQTSCQEMKGPYGCSMMEGGMGPGMMGGGMMQGQGMGTSQGTPSTETPSGTHDEHGH
jgi:hypothetical protein